MDQNWFEMPNVRRRTFADSVWVPLRAINRIEKIGEHGYSEYKEEFFGAGSLAVPIDKKTEAEKLGWMNIGISHSHSGYVDGEEYIPSNIYRGSGDFSGEHLVLDQRGNLIEHREWHLSQDYVVTLGLKREGDKWVRPDEGYIVVAKLHRQEDGAPYLLEARAEHLRDYLCARKMALYITSYRSRIEVVEDASNISWNENPLIEKEGMDNWEGRVNEIHEGGMSFGGKAAIFHVSRTDVDSEEDVPKLTGPPTDNNIESKKWTKEFHGRKLYEISGELWRNEWIEPASKSPLIREDEIPPTVFFITDAEGKQESRETLVKGGRWLWFKPDVVVSLAHRRGGSLSWYTRDTGSVGCSPDYNVHFGINSLGLVNVYAKDIGMLPDWQQRIWAGHNIGPEGGVSEELLASQARAVPANTQAPESFLLVALNNLDQIIEAKYGIKIIRSHDKIPELIKRSHRFRATSETGFFALAKDLARLTADSFDAKEIQKIVPPPQGETWASLKSLEKLLATLVDPEEARKMLSPLVGIYELRHADAHLSGKDIEEAFKLLGVDRNLPTVIQGYQLLNSCVSCIYEASRVIREEE